MACADTNSAGAGAALARLQRACSLDRACVVCFRPGRAGSLSANPGAHSSMQRAPPVFALAESQLSISPAERNIHSEVMKYGWPMCNVWQGMQGQALDSLETTLQLMNLAWKGGGGSCSAAGEKGTRGDDDQHRLMCRARARCQHRKRRSYSRACRCGAPFSQPC